MCIRLLYRMHDSSMESCGRIRWRTSPPPNPIFMKRSVQLSCMQQRRHRRGKTTTNFCLSMQDHRGKAHSEEVMTLGTVSLSNTCPRVVAELEIRFRNPHNENDEGTPHVGQGVAALCVLWSYELGRLSRTEQNRISF